MRTTKRSLILGLTVVLIFALAPHRTEAAEATEAVKPPCQDDHIWWWQFLKRAKCYREGIEYQIWKLGYDFNRLNAKYEKHKNTLEKLPDFQATLEKFRAEDMPNFKQGITNWVSKELEKNAGSLAEISTLKTDIQRIEGEIKNPNEISALKRGLQELKDRVKDLSEETDTRFTGLEGKFNELQVASDNQAEQSEKALKEMKAMVDEAISNGQLKNASGTKQKTISGD